MCKFKDDGGSRKVVIWDFSHLIRLTPLPILKFGLGATMVLRPRPCLGFTVPLNTNVETKTTRKIVTSDIDSDLIFLGLQEWCQEVPVA